MPSNLYPIDIKNVNPHYKYPNGIKKTTTLEVHQSRVLGEWSNIIGYEMGSSSWGLHYGQDFSTEDFKYG